MCQGRQWRNALWLTGEEFHSLQFSKTLNASFFRCQSKLGQKSGKVKLPLCILWRNDILNLGSTWRWVASFTPRPIYSQGMSTRNALNKICGNKMPTSCRCFSILQTGHITLSSTPDQQLENHSAKYHRQQPLYNTLELLMIGIVVPEKCWASNKICNKNLCCN